MMNKLTHGIGTTIAAAITAIIVITAICFVTGVLPAYFEAQAYNRITGANVSTWEAVWVELRVDCSSPPVIR